MEKHAYYRQITLDDGAVLWFAKSHRGYIAVGGFTRTSEGLTIPLNDEEIFDRLFGTLEGANKHEVDKR